MNCERNRCKQQRMRREMRLQVQQNENTNLTILLNDVQIHFFAHIIDLNLKG